MPRHKLQKGFTLIELLIAIAIFTMLSSFMVVSFTNDEKIRLLKEQADLVLVGIDQARNFSLAGSGPSNIYSQQFVFTISNCQADCFYEVSGRDPNQQVVKKNLEGVRVAIKNEASNQLSISFAVPRGRMTLSGDGNPSEAKIEISNSSNAFCVQVNSISGKVEEIKGNCP
ncbi:MAG: prepilin-type N-terminal cleavage/methylation domain-containing protein [Patescibacteria group bacterium]|jgi:prepilin-type N-terminal cleavage/methylation domain-containing protein